ncbi:MAG: hypothetical protein HQK60_16770 [Deltaproteobacteria bacterium]|nr:hypothetical protein [Deltaproteobacteria bacterium]
MDNRILALILLTLLWPAILFAEEELKVSKPLDRSKPNLVGPDGHHLGFEPPPWDLSDSVPKEGFDYSLDRPHSPAANPQPGAPPSTGPKQEIKSPPEGQSGPGSPPINNPNP